MAVMMAGFQVLGDVRKRGQIFRVLRGTRDIPDLMLSYNVLNIREEKRGKENQLLVINNIFLFYISSSSIFLFNAMSAS